MKCFFFIAVLSTEPEDISLDVDSDLMRALGVSYIAPVSNEEEIVDSEWAKLMKDSPDKKKISGKGLIFHGPKIERLTELHRTIVTDVVVPNPENLVYPCWD